LSVVIILLPPEKGVKLGLTALDLMCLNGDTWPVTCLMQSNILQHSMLASFLSFPCQ